MAFVYLIASGIGKTACLPDLSVGHFIGIRFNPIGVAAVQNFILDVVVISGVLLFPVAVVFFQEFILCHNTFNGSLTHSADSSTVELKFGAILGNRFSRLLDIGDHGVRINADSSPSCDCFTSSLQASLRFRRICHLQCFGRFSEGGGNLGIAFCGDNGSLHDVVCQLS